MATTKPNIQIDHIVREMTIEEHTAYKAEQTSQTALHSEANAARESALAKLAALGLTADEIAAL